MEPNDNDLRDLLKEWDAPPFPSSIEKRLFSSRRSWWRSSLPLPIPLACCLALLLAFLTWRSVQPAPQQPAQVLIRTERVEVPIIRERVVTKIVYKRRPIPSPKPQLTFNELKPVGELRIKIVRHQNAQN